MLLEAIKLYGTSEVPGKQSNEEIMKWADELGLSSVYKNDDTAWCGLFVAICAKRAGKNMPFNNQGALWARNWAKFGSELNAPELGCVLVFARQGGGGHVAIYVGEDENCYHCLGGNQSNKVTITRILKSRLIAARNPEYNAKPANVRKVVLNPTGIISQNEA
jgi:uncharacterized protein (TIGR02594 family)